MSMFCCVRDLTNLICIFLIWDVKTLLVSTVLQVKVQSITTGKPELGVPGAATLLSTHNLEQTEEQPSKRQSLNAGIYWTLTTIRAPTASRCLPTLRQISSEKHGHLVEVWELLVPDQGVFVWELAPAEQAGHLLPVGQLFFFTLKSLHQLLFIVTVTTVSSNQPPLETRGRWVIGNVQQRNSNG